jgi:putative tricarboxylic transport membrane protein
MARRGRASAALATAAIGSFVAGTLGIVALTFVAKPIGIDQLTGQSRLTFGVEQLGNGIYVVIVAVGLFAVGEALHIAAKLRKGDDEELLDPDQAAEELADPDHTRPARWLGREDVKRSWKPWVRGAAIGFPFGALPAGGAELPTFLSRRSASIRCRAASSRCS